MVLTEGGHVYSWGWNNCGQLGIGNTVHSNEPKFVTVIDENKCNVFIEKISCGTFHSLFIVQVMDLFMRSDATNPENWEIKKRKMN